MDGSFYRPTPARCTRSADRRAIRQALVLTLVMTITLVGLILLTGTFFPDLLDPSQSWLGYVATMQ